MSHPTRGGRKAPITRRSRKQREQLAFGLAVGGGGAGVLGVAGLVLSLIGIVGAGIPILLIIVAIACAFAFRSTVGG